MRFVKLASLLSFGKDHGMKTLCYKDYLSPCYHRKEKKKKKQKKKSLILAAESWLQCSVQYVDKLQI